MQRFIHHTARILLLVATLAPVGGIIPARAAADVIRVTDKPIVLEVSTGSLIRLARPASTVFVADPDIADVQVKSPRLIYLLAKSPGETVVYAVDKHEHVLLNRPIRVVHDLSRLRSALRQLLPDARIGVESVDNALVLTGEVNSGKAADEARLMALRFVKNPKNLVNKISVDAPNQVNLRVRVAEVSRNLLKHFGINWDAVVRTGSFLFGVATGNPTAAAGSLITRNNGTDSIFGSLSTHSVDLNGVIDALNSEGLINVLAEPNLTAVSGHSATFLAGGEFPILVPGNNQTTTVMFKQVGVSLSFTPVLVGDRISLKVSPEVSQLSTTGEVKVKGYTIPALTTRRASTTVELGSGQSFAIAGLLQNSVTHDLQKVPGLGDLPVLGPLFRSDSFKRHESELVIIVTPYIVRPVDSRHIALPTDGFVPPDDTDRLLLGRSYKPNLKRIPRIAHGRGAPDGLVGPAGFVLD